MTDYYYCSQCDFHAFTAQAVQQHAQRKHWNGKFGSGCNRPVECVYCDIIECPGRRSEKIVSVKRMEEK